MIGINKATVNNIKILSVDFNKLNARDNVKISTNKERISLPTATGGTKEVHSIKIKDGYVFDRFYCGITGMLHQFCVLELGVKDLCGDDMYPVNVEAYKRMLKQVRKYMDEVYGIKLNFDDVCLKEIEINNTFKLDRNFEEYEYLIEKFEKVAPKRYERKEQELNGLELNNSLTTLRIYDKKYQLEHDHGLKVNDELMRIEYTFKTSDKIKAVFGTNKLNELTDEAIKQCWSI